jgi:hypothetical protein
MLIECLIQRDGPTHITIDRFQYTFEKNEHGQAIAEVNSRSHRDYLLSLPDFRECPLKEINLDSISNDSGSAEDNPGQRVQRRGRTRVPK